ncbi:MAG: DUF4105 domain-containing protein [Rhodoferax sp.]|nr:DUF4105 domain-containing protein [Rhodoferax sp.]
MVSGFFKSGILAAFFLGLITFFAHAQAQTVEVPAESPHKLENSLALNPVWQAMLHLQHGKPQITDPNFLLSWPAFSSQAELQATLHLLHASPQTAACRFPARIFWLQSQMDLTAIDTLNCPEIREFTEKAPFDRLELVFADKSVTQPASVLGHSFLNVVGTQDGHEIEHAISFYTSAETFNLPKLLWESLITGKKGLFSLTPYALEEHKYLEVEQRNLWRYEIRTSPFERTLIRNHLFELKNSQLTYFFHQYNCATVLYNILGLTGDMPPNAQWWITPTDLVKKLNASNRIENTKVSLADTWLVTNLAEDIPQKPKIRQEMLSGFMPFDKGRIEWTATQLTALRAYNRWLQHQGKIDTAIFENNLDVLNPASEKDTNLSLKVDDALEPSHSQGETHLRTELATFNGHTSLRLQWIPVSHTLMQLHSHASAETEMVLLSPVLAMDTLENIHLEELEIFSMKSLIPWNAFLRTWSAQTIISYGRITSHPLDSKGLHAAFELGAMSRYGQLDFYGLTGPGLNVQSNLMSNAFLKTDIGVLWRHSKIAKSRLTWTNWEGSAFHANRIEFEQSWLQNSNWLFSWKLGDVEQVESHHKSLAFTLMRTF